VTTANENGEQWPPAIQGDGDARGDRPTGSRCRERRKKQAARVGEPDQALLAESKQPTSSVGPSVPVLDRQRTIRTEVSAVPIE